MYVPEHWTQLVNDSSKTFIVDMLKDEDFTNPDWISGIY